MHMMNNNLSYECSWQKHRARRRVHAQVTLRSKSAILACKLYSIGATQYLGDTGQHEYSLSTGEYTARENGNFNHNKNDHYIKHHPAHAQATACGQ